VHNMHWTGLHQWLSL